MFLAFFCANKEAQMTDPQPCRESQNLLFCTARRFASGRRNSREFARIVVTQPRAALAVATATSADEQKVIVVSDALMRGIDMPGVGAVITLLLSRSSGR